MSESLYPSLQLSAQPDDPTVESPLAEGLKSAEDRFRCYFDLGLVGMSTTSPTKRFIEVNDELCRMLGYEREELLKKTWAELTHPDDLPAELAQFQRLLAGEIDNYRIDKRWIRKDGSVIDTIMARKCARRPDGSVEYFVGFVLDTTERRRTEAALLRSEAVLAEGQRITFTGSWAWNAVTKEIYSSRELLRIFGLEHGPVPGTEEFLNVIHPDDRGRVHQTFENAVARLVSYEAEFRIVLADGSLRHVRNLAYPIFNDAGALVEYVGTAVDDTERRRAEEKLSDSERRFRLLAESIPHHVWSVRPDGSLSYWNQRLIDYTGLTEEQLRSGGWEGMHPDDRWKVKAVWEKAWSEGAVYEIELRIRGRDGHYRRFACCGVPVKDAQGRPVEWLGTNTDVEQHRQAEEQLRETQAHLERVMRVTAMGELAASIAHEVNQPLGAIVNNGNACLRLTAGQVGISGEVRGALLDIVEDATRAGAIIARIRAFANRSPGERICVWLSDVVRETLVLARPEIAKQRIVVRNDVPDDLPFVLADRIQLQQVLLNLILNAIDAMATLEDAARRVLVIKGSRYVLHEKPGVVISVSDWGVGIQRDAAARLFEAFYTTKPEGMGLGLRISHAIIAAHGGRLWAMPNDGLGSTFSFALPLGEAGSWSPQLS